MQVIIKEADSTICSIKTFLHLGKSTLVKMIQGKIQPDAGELLVGETVKLAVIDQDRDGLEGLVTVMVLFLSI